MKKTGRFYLSSDSIVLLTLTHFTKRSYMYVLRSEVFAFWWDDFSWLLCFKFAAECKSERVLNRSLFNEIKSKIRWLTFRLKVYNFRQSWWV